MSLEEQLEGRAQVNEEWPALVERARQTFIQRRRRARFFNPGMFSEPAWEVLLALYIEHNGRRLTIAQLTEYVGLPSTTVLRWLDYLEDQQLVARRSNPMHGRTILIELTEKGRTALDLYFSETPASL